MPTVLPLISLVLAITVTPQNPTNTAPTAPPADKRDVGSIDAIIAALYDVISGPANQHRNWERMTSLFAPGALMGAVFENRQKQLVHRSFSLPEYIRLSSPIMLKDGFFEHEIGRKTERFGNIAQVFSAYESRFKKEDAKPFERGINSIQLAFDGTKWQVVSILWEGERPGLQIPREFLRK